jgi:hypothetical protein
MAGIYGADGADTRSGTPGDDIILGILIAAIRMPRPAAKP